MRESTLSFVLCSLLQLIEPAATFPTNGYSASRRAENGSTPLWDYYRGVDAATHKTNYDDFSGKGYRPISLSSNGSPPNAEYAAVWVQRSGPDFIAIHNVDASAFQAWVDSNTQGHVPTLVTATGPSGSAVFSAVMEIGNITWTQQCDMTDYSFEGNNQRARSLGQSLKSFTQYGSSGDYRFCAIWHEDSSSDSSFNKIQTYRSPALADQFQAVVDTETSKPYWRPESISISEDGGYTSMWTDTDIGSWDLRYDLSAAELDSEIKKQKSEGKYPVRLSGGGSGETAKYAAIFAPQDLPSKRNWRVTGPSTTGLADNGAKAESIIQGFMQKSGVRQVQLSIARNGESLLDKAYTWSEPERVTTQVNDTFLLASVSKAFCAAAIQSLYDANKLTPDTKVYPLLGYSNPADARQQDITVQQLVEHTAGFKRSVSGDPAYEMREIALAQSNGERPASLKDMVDYMYKQQLDYTPGTDYEYGNYNYMLLSYVVEHVTNQPYFTYLLSTILSPEALNVKRWLTDPATHAADNVIQESASTGPSARQPLAANAVAHVYGGDGQFKDATLGTTGLAASAQSLVAFARRHAAYGIGGRGAGYRDGTTSGARTYVESRWDGVDWALTINTRDFPNGDGDFNDVTGAVNAWLDGLGN